jgi:putative flavoprotein involved in K+ transport
VLVLGAGETGLTVAYYLREAGLRFVIVDAADPVGSAWVERWDSLVLFTPRRYNAMPGLPFDGEPDREPTRDDVVAYLHRYATELDLPIELNSPVTALNRDAGRYAAEPPGRTIVADQVIVATGPFQNPRIPAFARLLSGRSCWPSAHGRPAPAPAGG